MDLRSWHPSMGMSQPAAPVNELLCEDAIASLERSLSGLQLSSEPFDAAALGDRLARRYNVFRTLKDVP